MIRQDYPKVLVPSIKEGSFVALEPYRFEKKDLSSGIMLAINKLSYYNRKYQGFIEFEKEVIKLVDSFKKAYPTINKLHRTGFRYVNIIPFTREKGIIPLDSFLNIELQMPKIVPKKYNNISIGFAAETNSGSITARVEPMMAADQSVEAILLDIDYAKKKNLSILNVKKDIDESHKYARQLFEDLITDNYRMFLRGETL